MEKDPVGLFGEVCTALIPLHSIQGAESLRIEITEWHQRIGRQLHLQTKRLGGFQPGGGNPHRDGQRAALPRLHVKGDASSFQVDGILAHKLPV